MFKTSLATRIISIAVLITVLLASFPTPVSAAKTNNRGLEAKWARLVDSYKHQSLIHDGASRWVNQWLADNPRASKDKKAELLSDLAKSNAAWAPVPFIVMRHNGFDANGKVVDQAAAKQSIKDLSSALQRYNGSMKKLKAFYKQLKLGG